MDDRSSVERRAMRKVSWRLMPFLILCYLIAYIDRTNIGFASLTMNADIGLSSAAFGLGGSLFFVAYVLFEVPSNLAQQRFGARRWIARIMVSWGLVGLAMAFTAGPFSFYLLRFLLGTAEAGFFPGAVLFIAQWFPRAHRASMVAFFMIAIPLSNVLGSPLAALLLSLNGAAGLAGWQWLFIVEAIPAIGLGLIALLVLSDGPDRAGWLSVDERDWLIGRLAAERQDPSERHGSIVTMLKTRQVWFLTLIYCGSSATSNALSLWQPQIIKSFGLSIWEAALLNMIPFGVAALFMLYWGRRADRNGERFWATALPLLLTAASLIATLLTGSLAFTMVLLTLALVGNYAIKGPFWALAAEILPAGAAAAGLAAINALAHLGTAGAIAAVGNIHEMTGSYPMALIPLGLMTLLGALITISLSRVSHINPG
ncbi:MFS transporter [Sphingomonas sp. SUN039]|uniref:MFS transporter n=1 Tax=Sphingomonas sp. SUN039 TaxID=2937787 RepID=UPI002164B633|nr:MFS transporter [Sphingomonas sp. SUN039]UVO54580.1 MFS transporter [Sphingomonas sp. SUN039]